MSISSCLLFQLFQTFLHSSLSFSSCVGGSARKTQAATRGSGAGEKALGESQPPVFPEEKQHEQRAGGSEEKQCAGGSEAVLGGRERGGTGSSLRLHVLHVSLQFLSFFVFVISCADAERFGTSAKVDEKET